MNEITIKTNDRITFKLSENCLDVSISYPKKSTLKKRLEMLDKLKEEIRKI